MAVLEICATNFESAQNAANSGIKRVELCQELAIGGITPSYGLIKKVIQELKIETFVLIRPRSGDFCYSDADFDIMKQDIMMSKSLGCHGIVSGILNNDFTVDIKRTKELIALSAPLPFIFHRAFDHTQNAVLALETLMNLGVPRILTSGLSANAQTGLEALKALQNLASSKITIMPGGGINGKNIHLFIEAGFTEIHSSATQIYEQTSQIKIPMNSPKFMAENSIAISKTENIIEMQNKMPNQSKIA